jgi:hypothetical protein
MNAPVLSSWFVASKQRGSILEDEVRELCITSLYTVKNHVSSILPKLGLRSRRATS